MDKEKIEIEVNLKYMDENVEKAKELVELLEKANSLARELAGIDLVRFNQN